jgi:hypothetical protein
MKVYRFGGAFHEKISNYKAQITNKTQPTKCKSQTNSIRQLADGFLRKMDGVLSLCI